MKKIKQLKQVMQTFKKYGITTAGDLRNFQQKTELKITVKNNNATLTV